MALLYLLLGIIAGIAAGIFLRNLQLERKEKATKAKVEDIIHEANRLAESVKKESLLSAKEEILQERKTLEEEVREKRKELQTVEDRLLRREDMIERRIDQLEKKESTLENLKQEVTSKLSQAEELKEAQEKELTRIAGLSVEQAKEELLRTVEKNLEYEIGLKIKESEDRARKESERIARELVVNSIQRYAAEFTADNTVAVVSLPNDDMKGRIIGREGRNIRAFEMMTGVDLIIDDTPEAVIISSFDPIRREIARISLEKLIGDGRIHPARIEELIEKAKLQVEDRIIQEGEQALFDTGVKNINPDLIKLLGKLYYRTSYGQNVLQHSKEVAFFAGLMAGELGLNPAVVRRAGLLHDIGKAVDHEVEGPHALIGKELVSRYGEREGIIHAVEAHHDDVEPKTIEAVLVQAADAISASRPGARRESLESYIKRLEQLEKIAGDFEGVDKTYAIQAGREVRIIVKPEKLDDARATKLAHDVVKRVEKELEYPGQIRVTVIRETRAVEYAK